jgi:hypothetical protein
MQFKFRIGYDDQQKIIPIFQKFGRNPFTRARVVATEGLPLITSGDVVRWESRGMIEKVGKEALVPGTKKKSQMPPYLWRLSDRTVHALTKKPKKVKEIVE